MSLLGLVIDIIIPSFNCLDKLMAAIQSVRSGTKLGWRAFVIDNASEDGAREWLLAHHALDVILNETNAGFSKATNQGIGMSMRNPASEWTVLMNNDVVVPDGWDEIMLDILDKKPSVGICSPLLLKPRGRLTPKTQARRALRKWGRHRMVDVDWLGLSCGFVHKRMWQRYGLLRDDRKFWHWGSDTEFCKRVLRGGERRVCYFTGMGVLHFHSASKIYISKRREQQRMEDECNK